MKYKLLLTILLGLFLISCVSALDSLGVGKQGKNFTVVQTCNDANYITLDGIVYPDKTYHQININMTSSASGTFVYNFTQTTQLGRYDVIGTSDGCEGEFAYYFEVTPSGFVGTLGFYIILLILALGFIILGYFVEDAWIVMLGSFGLILFGLFIFIYGVNGMKDMAYTYGFAIITIMLGCYLAVRAALENIGEIGGEA
jgi:hypothetical protein